MSGDSLVGVAGFEPATPLDGGPYMLGRRRAVLQHVFWQTDRLQPIDERGEGGDLGTCTSSDTLEKPLRFNSA
jgi:hypothetical protein